MTLTDMPLIQVLYQSGTLSVTATVMASGGLSTIILLITVTAICCDSKVNIITLYIHHWCNMVVSSKLRSIVAQLKAVLLLAKGLWQCHKNFVELGSVTCHYLNQCRVIVPYYNMTVWILARNDINLSMAAGLIRLHMPGVKSSRV